MFKLTSIYILLAIFAQSELFASEVNVSLVDPVWVGRNCNPSVGEVLVGASAGVSLCAKLMVQDEQCGVEFLNQESFSRTCNLSDGKVSVAAHNGVMNCMPFELLGSCAVKTEKIKNAAFYNDGIGYRNRACDIKVQEIAVAEAGGFVGCQIFRLIR